VRRAKVGLRNGLVDTLLRRQWRELLLSEGLQACAEAWDTSARHIARAVTAAREMGFVVELEPGFERSATWFERHSVVVLVAHAHEHHIEFADRLVDFEELIAHTPPDYDGLLELIGCETAYTGDQIRFARPKMRVSYRQRPTPLDLQLFIFRGVLECMRRTGLSYELASTELRKHWAQRLKK
jgi:hypothetical protein